MQELLAARQRSALAEKPLDVSDIDGGEGQSGSSSIGREFSWRFRGGILTLCSSCSPSASYDDVCSSLEHHGALALAALRSSAVHGCALAAAFASRSGVFLLATWLAVDTGVRVVVVLSYAAWCLIFVVVMDAAAMAFA